MFKQLQDMALFALVAELGSFTAAAQKAELPKSSVSQRISQLEQQVGIRLLNRTTRRLNLTFAGEHYLVHCREMLAASERAEYAIQRLRENPSGRLRITCPAGIGATLLAHLNAEFQLRYPDVSLDVSISDDVLDLVESGFDVALRTGKPQDSSLIGRMIGHCPRYMLYARECAIAGAGITLLPAFLLEDKVEKGALVKVLPEWNVEGNDLWLAYPSRKLNSPALMRYIDFAMQCDEVKRFYVGG